MPALRSAEARLLSAELRGDEQQWQRIRDRDLADGWWMDVMPVAFALAAHRRFGRSVDRRMITRFASRFVELSPSGDEFTARDVEAVIRAVTGEDHLRAAIAPGRTNKIMHAVLFGLADDLQLDDQEADALLDDAEQAIAAAHERCQNHLRSRPTLRSPTSEGIGETTTGIWPRTRFGRIGVQIFAGPGAQLRRSHRLSGR